MILTLRRSLLVFLVLLQMIAPLVHAHSSNHFAQFGLHLPNLEVYSAVQSEPVPTLQSADYLFDLDDAIVSISTGIKNQQNNSDDLSLPLYFPPTSFVFSVVLKSGKINFSPQKAFVLKEFLHSPQSPRAPPRPFF